MDLSLKQRLLGAAVLIALAVIFVPMLMSGSAPRKSAEMETSNLAIPPAPDREFQTRALPVDASAANPGGATQDRLATVDTATAPAATPATPETPPASTPAPVPPAAGPESAAPASTKPAVEVAKATPPPAPARAPEAPTAPGTAASGRFYVHLGVYAATRNADELVASLRKAGFPAFGEASEFKGKPAERVRVGPFEDRAAAEAARLRIRKDRPTVPGSVVELASDAAADAPASAVPAGRAGGWAVQLGALKSVDDANKLRDRVRNAGFAAFVDRVEANGATLWRVRAGPEVDRGAADRLKAGIHDKLKLDGIVVAQP
jgi:DedD protein